jgi:poly-gamma-glutamate capsule biosynthesis protein CapA/YwtB (metallophosphatase superfamily)
MNNRTLTMLSVGDLILFHPDSKSLFALVAPVLRSADVVVGQGEVPFTSRGITTFAKSAFTHAPNPVCDPSNISSLSFAGFNVITIATNHIWDGGVPGIEDTIDGLQNAGIVSVGAGMNIDEARRPAIIERDGTRIGFLDYNCVGPEESWATPVKPGCAYVHIVTAYELDEPCPGAPPTVYSFAEPRSLQAMIEDIYKLRPLCDVLVVKFHKGLGFVPIKLAMYEQQVSYAAIDAGADLIMAEHAHILKGIEVYKGKAIFHGLGNFVCTLRAFPKETAQEIRSWVKKLYQFEPDSENPMNVFHPEASQTIVAKCTIDDGRIYRLSYLPCLINEQDQPEILKNDERGQQVFDYVDKITREAGLNALYEWEGDEVVIHSG